MTAYVYGQAPGKRPKDDPTVPFLGGKHGAFLADLAGVSESVLADLFTFRNVLDYYPGAREDGGKGDAFPMDEARRAASELREDWRWGDTVIAAGWNVARAFGFKQYGYFKWMDIDGVQCVVAPHPSRLNRYWNDTKQVAAARAFWHQAVHEVMMLHPEYEGGMLV